MIKKKSTKILKELCKEYPEHDQLQSLCEELLIVIPTLEEKSKKPATKGELPLPKEITDPELHFALFSDGGCRGNPGPGAFAFVVQNGRGDVLFEISNSEPDTTNNRMELSGAIRALEAVDYHLEEVGILKQDATIFLYSDSKYVVDGINSWVAGWKKRGWKKADKKTPENLELWQQLDELNIKLPNVHFLWVKGHAGHPQNERCDELLNQAMDQAGC